MKAYELLDGPDKFVSQFLAVNAKGKECVPDARDAEGNYIAVKWCTIGAISFCYGPKGKQKMFEKLHSAYSYNVIAKSWKDAHRVLRELDI